MDRYRTVNDIIKEKREYIAGYDAKITAWSAVKINKKKDGNEFAELSKRCVDGARIADKTYTAGKEIVVSFHTPMRAYDFDSIDYCLSPQDMREAIEKRITLYKGYKAETENALEWLEENADTIKAKMEAFRTDLLDGAPDDIGIRHAFGEIVDDGIKYGFR